MTFWVNERSIDCGICWQWDPQHFAPAPSGDTAHVWRQPEGEPETTRALLALRACPVAAIQAPADQVRRTPGLPPRLLVQLRCPAALQTDSHRRPRDSTDPFSPNHVLRSARPAGSGSGTHGRASLAGAPAFGLGWGCRRPSPPPPQPGARS
jgi:ferredoxin